MFPADVAPGLRRGGLIGNGSPSPSAKAGGVVDSYRGEGCRVELEAPPLYGVPCGRGLGASCKLALLACPLTGLLVACPVLVTRLSLAVSLPRDMMESERPWPLAGTTALFGAFTGRGALFNPPLDGALTTLRDKVGLCPRVCDITFGFIADCALASVGFVCETDGVVP